MPYKVSGTVDTRILTYKNPFPLRLTFPRYCELDAEDYYALVYTANPEETLNDYCPFATSVEIPVFDTQEPVDPSTIDPHWANVVLYLQGNGANNSTNILDTSGTPKTITRFGDTNISTAQSKYGGSSIYFDGNGDYLTCPSDNFALGTSDFTLECWVYLLSSKADHRLFGTYNVSQTDRGWTFYIRNTTFSFFEANISNYSFTTIDLNQWVHLAVTRQGNTLRVFVNGTLINTYTVSFNDTWTGNPFFIGSSADRALLNNNSLDSFCYMDSVRITAGIARYTTSFNPETDTNMVTAIQTGTQTVSIYDFAQAP